MKISRICALAVVFLAASLFGQVAVTPFVTSQPQFLDNNGNPLAAGCVFSYAAGTSTPQATYTDNTGNTQNANPIILNAGGFAPSAIWVTGQSYKFTVKSFGGSQCASGSTVRTEDNVKAPIASNLANTFTGATTFSGPVTFTSTISSSGTNSFSGSNTFSGATNFTGAMLCKTFLGTRCIDPTNAQGWAGTYPSDWANSAFSNCTSNCRVLVAPGTYTSATTGEYPSRLHRTKSKTTV
jgi:hypothetical protein